MTAVPDKPLTDSELSEIEARAKAATPGPWTIGTMRPNTYGMEWITSADVDRVADCSDAVGFDGARNAYMLRVGSEKIEANAAFIAHARTDIPRLLATISELRETLRELEDANAALCSTRSQETYLRMIDIDNSTDALLRLDEARSKARASLNQAKLGAPTNADDVSRTDQAMHAGGDRGAGLASGNVASAQDVRGPSPEAWLAALKLFGYAPGEYMIKCANCGGDGKDADGNYCDKRAMRCKACAEQSLARFRPAIAALSTLPQAGNDWNLAIEEAAKKARATFDDMSESLQEGLMTDAALSADDRTKMRAQLDAIDVLQADTAQAIRALSRPSEHSETLEGQA